jgi:hypothetical protein
MRRAMLGADDAGGAEMSKKHMTAAASMPELGELRAALAYRRGTHGWALVRGWAEQAWEADPQQFEEVWLPYLRGQLADWPARLCDAPKRWLQRALMAGGFGPLHIARSITLPERELLSGIHRPADWVYLDRWATIPELASVERLHTRHFSSDAEIEAMGAPGAWPALRELIVDSQFGPVSDATIWTSALLPRLESLTLGQFYKTPQLGDAQIVELGRLRHLCLSSTRSHEGALGYLRAVASALAMPALESLDLSRSMLHNTGQRWHPLPLSRSPLRSIDLSYCSNLADMEPLSALGPTLEALDLTHLNPGGQTLRIDDALLTRWLRDPETHSPLKRLTLAGAKIGAASLVTLRDHNALPHLEHLGLSRCAGLDAEAIAQLCALTHLSALRSVSLEGCPLDTTCVQRLIDWPLFAQLTTLDVRKAGIHKPGIRALRAANPALTVMG